MKIVSVDEARAFIRTNGVSSRERVEDIIGGFEWTRHVVYIQDYEKGAELYQFIRNSSAADLSPMAGSWFCLKGATTSGLAIIDGGSGRRLHRFRVDRPFVALEGVASPKNIAWSWSGGGSGGSTQVYVPAPLVRSAPAAIGGADRW